MFALWVACAAAWAGPEQEAGGTCQDLPFGDREERMESCGRGGQPEAECVMSLPLCLGCTRSHAVRLEGTLI